jgi:hypothetical protein
MKKKTSGNPRKREIMMGRQEPLEREPSNYIFVGSSRDVQEEKSS